MLPKLTFSIDVEPDLHTGKYRGVTEGLARLKVLCDKYDVKPILFVTSDCLSKNALIFKKFSQKGWEISFHGKSHKRFDEMSESQKEEEISSSVKLFKNKLGFYPKGFRAPQHGIDDSTLDLLVKYGFKYDSSYTPLNLLQLLFFPRKFSLWARNFFSRRRIYHIRRGLLEIPTTSFFVPFVSLTLRVLPKVFLKSYIRLIKLTYERPLFYAHSWDFIEMKDSKVDRIFPHTLFLNKLEYIMKNESSRAN
ncbi:Polysaccharide deacetylase [uncultured archaeon]|nr:Polysaccharide deacetylase [uncultured archaeon]